MFQSIFPDNHRLVQPVNSREVIENDTRNPPNLSVEGISHTVRKYKFLAGSQFDVARNFRNTVVSRARQSASFLYERQQHHSIALLSF